MKAKHGKPRQNLAHSAAVSDVEIYKQGVATSAASFRVINPVLAAGSTPVDIKVAEWFEAVNYASKVVDANGEPLVVYHGTKSSFDAFRRDKIELDDAFIFTTSPQNAGEYAGSFGELQGDGGNIMPVFLNIREVNRYSNKEWLSNEGKEPADYSDFEGGVIIDQDGGNTYLVTNPTQIKSAIGNTGAFDGNNPDIRYSIPAGNSINNRGLASEITGKEDETINGADAGTLVDVSDMLDRSLFSNPKIKIHRSSRMVANNVLALPRKALLQSGQILDSR